MGAAKRITAFFIKKGIWEEEKADVYEYGLDIIISSVSLTSLLLIMGVFLNKLLHTIVFILVFTLLRTQSGGYHATTRLGCAATTIFLYLTVIACTYIKWCDTIRVKSAEYLLSIVLCAIYAPVENPNKPIPDEKKPVFRIRCVIIVTVLYVISLMAYKLEFISKIIMQTVTVIALLMINKEGGTKDEGIN